MVAFSMFANTFIDYNLFKQKMPRRRSENTTRIRVGGVPEDLDSGPQSLGGRPSFASTPEANR